MDAWRTALVDEGVTWLRTPWMHNQRLKGQHGGGVDCGQFLIGCIVNTGRVADFATGEYPPDWMMNQEEERYLGWIEKFFDRIEGPPLPGDVVAWRYGKTFSHGGLVVEWPLIIHAYRREGNVCYGDGLKGDLAREHMPNGGSQLRDRLFYSLKPVYRGA